MRPETPDIVERLDVSAEANAFGDDEAVMREAAGLIRRLDEAVAEMLSRRMPDFPLWAREILVAAANRHARRYGKALPASGNE